MQAAKLTDRGNNPFDFGLALIRMLMCFEVVLCHFWSENVPLYLKPFDILSVYAVPVFMVMSFYLNQKFFGRKDVSYAKKRVWKLLLPQIIWSVLYFLIYWIIGSITHHNLVNGISDLFWQCFTGHSPRLNATMWFQIDLIVITIIFFVVFYFCNQLVGLIVIVLIGCLCLALQYSGLNYQTFGALRYELSYPLGRLSETIPMAVGGFLLSKYNLLKPTKESKWNLLIAGIITITFLLFDRKLFIISSSFGYAGIGKIGVAIGLLMFSLNLNFNVFSAKILNCIKFISQYTLGIYCVHRLVHFFLVNTLTIIFGLSDGQFYQCIIIYIIGFVVCWGISKIPIRGIKNIV